MLKSVLGAGAALALSTTLSFAADLPFRKGAPVAPPASMSCLENDGLPTDVFGFTVGSDVTDLGAWGGTLTGNGAFTNRAARSSLITGTAQVATSPIRCVEIGPYAFVGGGSLNPRFGADANTTLYGGGVEFKYKFLGRATHGVGATLDVDVNVLGQSFTGLRNDTGTNIAVRLFLDSQFSPILFGALNLEHISTLSNRTGILAGDASQFNVRAALSAKVTSNLFIGAEAWYSRTYANGGFYKTYVGDGFFVGPNLLWQINDKWTFNAAYQVQVAGKAQGFNGQALNLNSYSQHYARVKLGYAF